MVDVGDDTEEYGTNKKMPPRPTLILTHTCTAHVRSHSYETGHLIHTTTNRLEIFINFDSTDNYFTSLKETLQQILISDENILQLTSYEHHDRQF